MIYSVAFPLITDTGGLIVRLWEDKHVPDCTVRYGNMQTTFRALLGNQYEWVDMQLSAQSRTLRVELGYEYVEHCGPATLSQVFGSETVKGNSASLALYFSTLFSLPELTKDFACSWVFTGSLIHGISDDSLALEAFALDRTTLLAKKRLIDNDLRMPNQVLICLAVDKDHFSPSPRPLDATVSSELRSRSSVHPEANVSFISGDNVTSALSSLGGDHGFKLQSHLPRTHTPPALHFETSVRSRIPRFIDLLSRALEGYEDIAAVARALAFLQDPQTDSIYTRPLGPFDLQLKAFNSEEAADLWRRSEGGRHVLISGPTGSGKTALLDILNLRAMIAQEGMALYLAPTRALAAEYHKNFTSRYAALLRHAMSWTDRDIAEKVVVSTGEDFEYDPNIRHGMVSLASVVTEKANVLITALQSELLAPTSRLRLVAFDELHMLSEPHRGGVIDLLLAKLRHHAVYGGRSPNAPLRLVGVSTESVVDDLARHRSFASGNPTSDRPGSFASPIVLRTDLRPLPVQHVISLSAPVGGKLIEIPVCEFSSTAQRRLNERTLTAISRQCAEAAAGLALLYNSPPGGPRNTALAAALVEAGVEVRNSDRPKRSQTAAVIVRQQLAAGYKSIIVALGSTDGLIAIGHQLVKSLPRSPRPEFERWCDESDVSDDLKAILNKFGAHGIFIHSADQPRKLREFIESTFSDVLDTSPKILLTTETLSYGVNLTADCVVLMGVSFPRERRFDDVAGIENATPLSANAFHNLLGRAGRYDKHTEAPSGTSKAVFVLDALHINRRAAQAFTQSEYREILCRYYAPNDHAQVRSLSALFFPGDPTTGEKGRSEANLAAEDKRTAESLKLQDFSYNAFRTICDTLRHLQFIRSNLYPENDIGILQFLRDWTVYCDIECGRYNETPTELQKWEERGVGLLVKNLTKKLIAAEYVLSTNDMMSLTPKAEALINTGVRPTAIEPIRKYFALLKGKPELPVECIAFAFCATPEFWNIAAKDLAQIMHWNELTESEGSGELYLIQSKLDFETTLRGLAFSDQQVTACLHLLQELYDQTVLEDQAGRLYASSSYRPGTIEKFQPVLNRTAYYTVCSTIIAWVNGINENELVAKYWVRKKPNGEPLPGAPAQEKKPNNIKVAISDKLGWLTQAAYKYFSDTPTLDPAIKAGLLELTDRFRYGVTASGLPFQIYLREHDRHVPPPSRSNIHDYVSKKQPAELINLCLTPSDMTLRARTFFRREITSKFFQFDREDTRENRALKTELETLFDTNAKLKSATIDSSTRACIQKWIEQENFVGSVSYAAPTRPVVCAPNGDWVELSCRTGESVLIDFTGAGAEGSIQAGARYLDSSDKCARKMSVFGGLLLIRFFARGILKSDALMSLMSINGTIPIRRIVTELSDENTLAQAGSLDEALLSFREPGW